MGEWVDGLVDGRGARMWAEIGGCGDMWVGLGGCGWKWADVGHMKSLRFASTILYIIHPANRGIHSPLLALTPTTLDL